MAFESVGKTTTKYCFTKMSDLFLKNETKKFYFTFHRKLFQSSVYSHIVYLTYKVDPVWQRSGSQWSRVLGQALIKEENYGAVPASLKAKDKHHHGY